MSEPGLTYNSVERHEDVVDSSSLPEPLSHIPYHDLNEIAAWSRQQPDRVKVAISLPPPPERTDPSEYLINFELLNSFARFEAADRFRYIIRMGGGFNHLRSSLSIKNLEAYAVQTMGLDASLYFHGAEQARRMERLMVMNQVTHRKMFAGVVENYGLTRVAARTYAAFRRQVPNFSTAAVEMGMLTGSDHDYGEVALKHDKAFDRKDRHYEEHETAECVKYATDLHTPLGSPSLMRLLERRLEARRRRHNPLTPDEQAEVAFYLHPKENIYTAYVVERSEVFKKAVEPTEYVLSGIRAFEAVEHDFGNLRADPVLATNLLRLGVGTFYNHLTGLMPMAERYTAIYDFLRQNDGMISRYLDIMTEDIVSGWSQRGRPAIDLFGFDPFANFEEGHEPISANEARHRLLKTHGQWKKWRNKTHIVKTLWENYFGTTHALTVDLPDVSFLQYTARHHRDNNSRVPVKKPLTDMFGVSLDSESQAEHESLVLRETGIMPQPNVV